MSETLHVKTLLIKCFLSFLEQIRSSEKTVLKDLLKLVQHDTRSTTGKNLRSILLLTGKAKIDKIMPQDALKIKYHPIEKEDLWKVNMIREIVSMNNSQLDNVGMEDCELVEILDYLCTS